MARGPPVAPRLGRWTTAVSLSGERDGENGRLPLYGTVLSSVSEA